MSVDQLPARMREFVDYLDGLMARLDQGGGWCGVFWQRDPEGMRACLDGREVPPWDVVASLLHDLAAQYGTGGAGPETERARALHTAALAAYDARPGGRDALGDRLDVMLREQRYAAERQAELGRLLASATTREEADTIRLDLAWARDDHERATARCAELRGRMADLEWQAAGARGQEIRRERVGEGAVFRVDEGGEGHGSAGDRSGDDGGFGEDRFRGGRTGSERHGGGGSLAGEGEWHSRAGATERPGSDRGRPAGLYSAGDLAGASDRPQAHGPAADGRRSAAGSMGHAGPVEATGARDWPQVHGSGVDGRGSAAGSMGHAGPGEATAASDRPHAPGTGTDGRRFAADPMSHPGPTAPDRSETQRAPAPAASGNPDPAPSSTPEPTPKQRKRRRGSARFAGIVEEEAAPVVVPPTEQPVLPAQAAVTSRRTPRGARFAGVAAQEAAVPPVESQDRALGTGDRQEVAGVVEALVRLRGEGRSGEAHVLLVEAAHWPAERLPLLAAEMRRAGLGADWATLLWEAASLPAERLVAAADALTAAGRAEDGEQILRQGVLRPAPEIGQAVLGLVGEGRRREVRALLDAYVRMRTPEEAARSVAPDPKTLVPLLLEAAKGVSEERQWDLVHALRVAGVTA
ncbi:hypothetical protein [Streptomyces sp. UG1]|uniref:hypothetical protein n=1 Tax=Streptomyces sp. UG1 TaxID=3417652 RepID=UPI003CE885E9